MLHRRQGDVEERAIEDSGTGEDGDMPEHAELIRRLRNLSWPEVSPEYRQRCWEDFSRIVEQRRKRS